MNELLNNLFKSILQFITTHFPQTSKNVHTPQVKDEIKNVKTIDAKMH